MVSLIPAQFESRPGFLNFPRNRLQGTHIQTDGRTDRRTDGTDRQTDRQTDAHTHTHTHNLASPILNFFKVVKKKRRGEKINLHSFNRPLLLFLYILLSLSGNSGRGTWVRLQQSQEQRYIHPVLQVHAGSFRVVVIHPTLTWTTGGLTCVRDQSYVCACIHTGVGHTNIESAQRF